MYLPVVVLSLVVAVASQGPRYPGDFDHGPGDHIRDACFCLGFNPDDHRQAAECMYAIITSAESYLSDDRGELITHLFNARTLLHDFLHESGHGHGSYGSHDSYEYRPHFWLDLMDVTCRPGSVEGRLIAYNEDGDHGTVCDDGFGEHEAELACRELGFHYGTLVNHHGDWYSESDDLPPIALDDLTCEGDHDVHSIYDCHVLPWGEHNCQHSEDVFLRCSEPYYSSDFYGDMIGHITCDRHEEENYLHLNLAQVECGPGMVEGLLVVSPAEDFTVMGTVCDDHFDDAAATVACRYLGFEYGEQIDRDGEETGFPIILDDVGCTGEEENLGQCRASPLWDHNCAHHEDVGLRCYEGTRTPVFDVYLNAPMCLDNNLPTDPEPLPEPVPM